MPFFRPRQDKKDFLVVQVIASPTARGRPMSGEEKILATIRGVLAPVDQEQVQQWKQNGHPISHSVIQENPNYLAPVGCILRYQNRRFEVKGAINPGEISHFCIYYCLERLDSNGKSFSTDRKPQEGGDGFN